MSRHHAHLNARRWAAVRRAVFERDGFRCRKCGKAGRLEADHIRPLTDGVDPFDMDNLQTLCRGCHVEKSREERRAAFGDVPGRDEWRAFVDSLSR